MSPQLSSYQNGCLTAAFSFNSLLFSIKRTSYLVIINPFIICKGIYIRTSRWYYHFSFKDGLGKDIKFDPARRRISLSPLFSLHSPLFSLLSPLSSLLSLPPLSHPLSLFFPPFPSLKSPRVQLSMNSRDRPQRRGLR